jgi:SAM-dependent methyltransferase
MKRTDIPDVNTPENYDAIYFGPRTNQLLAHPYIIDMLSAFNYKKGNVLDVGCGVGRYFHAFAGSKIYGTELSKRAITQVNLKYPDAEVVQWFSGTPLPFIDNFFNVHNSSRLQFLS